jgi:ketosteroid isomerase-like protein
MPCYPDRSDQATRSHMPHDNIAIKDRFVAAVFAGDTATLRELVDPAFQVHQPPGLAYAGSYAGADGFMRFIEKFMATFEVEALNNTDTFRSTDPDRVVLEFQFKGKVKATGEAFDRKLLECWEFRDGKVLRITVYWFAPPRMS